MLRRLLALRPALQAEAEKIARDLISGVSSEAVADEIQDAVKGLGIEDLHGRSGSHPWGYTEPGEAAWEVLEEAVKLFTDDMKRQLDLGLGVEALETCKGIVLGLYRLDRSKDADLLEWAPDFAAEAAGDAVEIWLRGGGGREMAAKSARARKREGFPEDFIARFVPEWADMFTRAQSKSRSR